MPLAAKFSVSEMAEMFVGAAVVVIATTDRETVGAGGQLDGND